MTVWYLSSFIIRVNGPPTSTSGAWKSSSAKSKGRVFKDLAPIHSTETIAAGDQTQRFHSRSCLHAPVSIAVWPELP